MMDVDNPSVAAAARGTADASLDAAASAKDSEKLTPNLPRVRDAGSSSRTKRRVSGASDPPFDAATARHHRPERQDDWLTQRIYTVSSMSKRPHFQFDGRRKQKPAQVPGPLPASPSRLDPIRNPDAPIAEAAESMYSGFGSKVLKAKNPIVIPASSTRSRSGGNRPVTGESSNILGLDAQALQSIINPGKRQPNDRGTEKEFSIFNTWGDANVIPPIKHDDKRTSGESAPFSSHMPIKRVRLFEPEGTPHSSHHSEAHKANEVAPIAVNFQIGMEDARKPTYIQSKNPFDFIQHLRSRENPGDFTYLNVVKKNESYYNPYCLEIVDFSSVDRVNGYYTLSLEGVTYFSGHGHGEFTPLKQWVREYDLFHNLLRIPFFMSYRLWKCFTLWRRHILHTKISRAKAKLTKSLFFVHPILRSTLLQIRSNCMDILLHRRLLRVKEGTTYFLNDFIKEQTEWVEECGSSVLKTWEANIRGLVEHAGIECLKEKGFDIQLQDLEEEKDDDGSGAKGISDDKVDPSGTPGEKLSFTEQAARRAECRRLQRFVKLIDYQIVSTLHMLAIDSARDFLRCVFRGCEDSDVVVTDIEDAGNFDLSGFIQNTQAEGWTQAIPNDQKVNSIQVGGLIVGKEITTSELISCGFDGFPTILSKITEKSKNQPLQLQDVVVEDHMEDVIGTNPSEATGKLSLQVNKNAQKNRKEKEAKPLVPLFKLELLLKEKSEDSSLYLSPALLEYIKAVDTILKAFLTAIQHVDLLSNTIPYLNPTRLAGGAAYVRGLEDSDFDDGPKIISILSEEGYFTEICGRLRGTFVGMFSNAYEWMKKWDDVRNMWLQNESFDGIQAVEASVGQVAVLLAKMGNQSIEGGVAAYLINALGQASSGDELSGVQDTKIGILQISSTIKSRADGTPYSPLVEFFETSLGEYSSQRQIMNAISVSSCINNFSVDTMKLKGILVPSPERCFNDVAKLLPGIARDKNEILLNEVQTWVRILNTQSQSIESFVEYLEWLEKIKDSMASVELFYEEVTRLYTVIDNYKIHIMPTDLALFQTLGPTLRQLKESVDMASDTKDESISRFSTDLDKAIGELMAEVGDIRNKAQDPMVLNPNSASELVIEFLQDLRDQLDRIENLKKKYEIWSELFKNGGSVAAMNAKTQETPKNAAPPRAGELEDTKNEVDLKSTLWMSLREWNGITENWRSIPFDTLIPEDINNQITLYLKTVYNLDKGLPPNDVVPKLKRAVEEFRTMYTTIVDLRNPALKARHWEKIQDALGKALIRDDSLTLGKLIEIRVFDFKEEIGNISSQAGSEAALEEMLQKVVKIWSEAEFIVASYRDSKDVFILGSVEDIQTLLEDSQVTIATIKGSRFIGPIKAEVERWDKQLTLFAETLDAWLTCQRNWLYLESIFSAPDIQRQLPDEARMFAQVDRAWKDTMRKVSRNPNAMKSGTMPGVLESMQQNNALLDQIQKCLEDYLESKRLLFPRFYFLSNEELLEILSQTRNPHAVQPHLSKCFDAIKSLEFSSNDPKSIDIVAMISPEGERVPFLKVIKARGNVEAWLSSVEEAMVSTLRRLLKLALAEFDDSKRPDWVREHVGQVVVAGNQILWTRDVGEAIRNSDPAKGLQIVRQKCINGLSGLAALVRGDLTKIQRAILGALITIDVHNRDIIEGLINAKVSGQADFEWVKQLKYYWDVDSDNCTIRMSSSTFSYGYEYLGCSARLVITPLTDRCYLTLTGAMQLNLGGSPVGPAGTGKTETVKDLAKALARQCVVFNCSDGLDYKIMGKMFAGLAQSGAWCCFDEFNRIDIEVLSVVAQQLLTIKNAKDMRATKFMFEGREIRLIDTCAAFITMNPGYAGRTELPDNLKALFRPIAMMIPDYGLIAEIMLFSEGFENAKVLAGKVVNLYKLCSEQLSQQDHYDFGMRAVKSVLIMAGALKRANPDLTEDVVLIQSLRDSNVPKFLTEDVGLFRGILTDLFPGTIVAEKDLEVLALSIKEVMSERKLEIVNTFVSRVCQLYETMKIRHGVMLVGPTGGGKTTCYEILRDACGRLKEKHPSQNDFQKVKTWVLNPKCVAMTELYGEFNPATMEWKDGLIGSIFRCQVSDNSIDEKWTVCDGPVDALWIENMNTVLDDNKLLTLINGERIKMNNTMHMLFEVSDLAVASPATVSRCGMVYMDPVSLGWWPYVKTWLRTLPEAVSLEIKDWIESLFDLYVEKGLKFVRRNCTEYLPSVDLNLVTSLCNIITTFINKRELVDLTQEYSELRMIFSHVFVFAYIWSIGGNLADRNHDAFDSFMRDLLEVTPIADVQVPASNNVFSFFVDVKSKNFSVWDDLVPAFSYSSEVPYFQMTVQTTDTVKYSYLLEALLSNGYPTLFTGNTGVGKSIIVQDLLNRVSKPRGFVPMVLNFSAQTSSLQTQQIIEIKLEKKRKNILGAPSGSNKIVLFVDDLNMPKLDTYGSQPPIELLRQYLDFKGFYDREKLTWKIVQDVEIVACCAPPGGGRNNITPRFLRHFNMLNIPVPTELSLSKIFRSITEGFLKPFSSEVKGLSEAIVSSAIDIYHSMCSQLLPTPAKSHYTFNLRDLSKVVQGILQVRPQNIVAKLDLVKIFCHESARVFQDRLIDDSDRLYFNKLLSEIVEKNFNVAIPKESFSEKPILFGDFLKRGTPLEERQYVEITDLKALNNLLEEYLEEFNVTMNKDVRLIFFLDAQQHISRISRIIRQPRGNALLVGVGGTGKQSLTRLACHISDFNCFQIELTRTYGMDEWREDLKKLYISSGVEGKNTVFLISDTQIKTEVFLEDINNILNSGEVPSLFEFDEREKILGDLRSLARDRGLPEDRDSMYQFFINRVRDNLHIVFATSPVGDTFRNRCRMFPSLVNCCTIDWFDEWPREALLSVSKRFFEFVDLGSDEMRDKIAEMCVEIHASVGIMAKRFHAELKRKYYTTPTSYLELINLYIAMLQEKRKELGFSRDRLRNGLNKLAETNSLVANMQIELEQLGPELKIKAADVETLMVKIAKDQEMADGVRKVVSEEETIVREKAKATEAIAEEAQRDLDQALPALQAAYKALDALDKKDIAELKVFTKPPELVLMVMEAVCILFKAKPDWEGSKKLLGDSQLMKKMQDFDKDNIPDSVIKKLKKYTENPQFNAESVEKVSKACKSMCMWVIAMDIYSRVYKEVLPKRRRLEEAQATLEDTRAKLAEKTAALQEVESQLDKLKRVYEESIASKRVLAEKMEDTTRRMGRASKLTLALADEQVRWTESVENLNLQIEALVGNIFLCAASVAYNGAFTSTYRQELVIHWIRKCQDIGIPVSENFNLVDHLVDQSVVRDWNIQGLPADPLSIENGIFVTRGRRWPLMIDPQGQANRWIRNQEGAELRVVKLSEPKFLRSLENAIRTGQPVLMEDVGEQLDPAIEPLLLKQTVRQGGRLLMKLGDSLVEYDRNFKLYITTKLANPHYLPEVCIKVTIINFTVTKLGLEGQLLADVAKLERPELEEQRNSLIVNIANDKKQLKDIEEKILKLLFNSQGNILDDEELINTLNQSKVTSAAIKERVSEAEATEKEINNTREKYRPVAIRGSVLYFTVADLAEMDPMYQFSLKYFKNLFNQCIIESEKSDNVHQRIAILCKNSTYAVFLNVCRGLFEAHKQIFAFMICMAILRQNRDISEHEWSFFLRGGGRLMDNLPAKPNAKWLSSSMWQNCCDLAISIKEFSYLMDHMLMYTAEWEEMINSDNPFEEPVPGDASQKLTDFQRLILIKVLREERLVQGAVEFVKKNLGTDFIDIPPLDLAKVYKDTSCRSPMIFILSTGSDPISALLKFASGKDLNMQDRLHMISLGQGQGPIAEELIRRASLSGDWIFLQNCHLAASWMGRLEAIIKDLSAPENDINPNFRLFLSSMPSKVFPTTVLQDGIKITSEPPKGLRANLARSFADVSRDLFDDHPPQGVKFKKLLFGVCFFNAIIHERKKFGPLGWNILYDWSNADLEVSITILKNILQESKTVPWDALIYLTGEITFGGRVTDDWDRRTLKSILAKFYTPQILEEAYRFSPSGIYFAPQDGDLSQYRSYIESLPFTEEPSIFGMHENANISYQVQESRRLLRTILDVQPRLVSSSAGASSEEIVAGIATAILDSWPEPLIIDLSAVYDPSSVREDKSKIILQNLFKRDESGRLLNSLSTVLSQETARFNRLLAIVRASLESLLKALKGLVVMSSEIELVFKSLLNNEVPGSWAAVAYPSLKPLGGWVKDLKLRIGFLTGVLQNHARRYRIPIDSLVFAFKISDYEEDDPRVLKDPLVLAALNQSDGEGINADLNIDELALTYPEEDGVLISGLFIEGARWDRMKHLLQDSFPMEMFSTMPMVRFIPTQIPQQSSSLYLCPLYKTSARAGTLSTTGHSTNFVLSINIPSDKPSEYWIAKGVALLVGSRGYPISLTIQTFTSQCQLND
ncbi:Dynein heavy chain 6, axonemal [Dinochytrium kinnereticum]|nr:Dynein heavy chain 6, axonemal [Dinochytrium kinnereticum]